MNYFEKIVWQKFDYQTLQCCYFAAVQLFCVEPNVLWNLSFWQFFLYRLGTRKIRPDLREVVHADEDDLHFETWRHTSHIRIISRRENACPSHVASRDLFVWTTQDRTGMCDVWRHFLCGVTLNVFEEVFAAQKTCHRMGRKTVFGGPVPDVRLINGTGNRSRKMKFCHKAGNERNIF